MYWRARAACLGLRRGPRRPGKSPAMFWRVRATPAGVLEVRARSCRALANLSVVTKDPGDPGEVLECLATPGDVLDGPGDPGLWPGGPGRPGVILEAREMSAGP